MWISRVKDPTKANTDHNNDSLLISNFFQYFNNFSKYIFSGCKPEAINIWQINCFLTLFQWLHAIWVLFLFVNNPKVYEEVFTWSQRQRWNNWTLRCDFTKSDPGQQASVLLQGYFYYMTHNLFIHLFKYISIFYVLLISFLFNLMFVKFHEMSCLC